MLSSLFPSFPRKRESRSYELLSRLAWTPAFAGATIA
jgi:hypothetical protein